MFSVASYTVVKMGFSWFLQSCVPREGKEMRLLVLQRAREQAEAVRLDGAQPLEGENHVKWRARAGGVSRKVTP